MQHEATQPNVLAKIAQIIEQTKPGDVLIVPSCDFKDLAERAKTRMRPGFDLRIIVKE